jgi:ribosomal protein S18 acetylase RimI-like enzyme
MSSTEGAAGGAPDRTGWTDARRAVRAHDELVTTLYGGELHDEGGMRLLYNRYLDEAEWSHAGAVEIDEGAWPERFAAVRDFFRRRQRVPAMVVDPWTNPPDLEHRLRAEGWSESFRHAGLLFPGTRVVGDLTWPAGASIEELASPPPEEDEEPEELTPFAEVAMDDQRRFPSMEAFAAVFEAAFGETAPGYSFAGYRRAIPAGFERPRPGVRVVHTLVRINGEPAAIGSRVHFDGVAGLYNLGVSPKFRGRDLGGILTLHRVAEARAEGAEVVFLLTENARVEAGHLKRGFERAFELVGWQETEEYR